MAQQQTQLDDERFRRRGKRRVVCAAIRAEDGDALIGIRHYSQDMRHQMTMRTDGEKFWHRHGDDQGFVDQWGEYLTREQAALVAFAAGQCVECVELYSEGLY